VTPNGRLVVYGACFGTRTNETLALAVAGGLTARLGARVDVAAVEPTWFVLELPIALEPSALVDAFRLDPNALEPTVERLVPSGLDYRWVFLTVARKLGLLGASSDPKELRTLEPLLEENRTTPLGEEVLEKTLHDRYDLDHAREVLAAVRDGRIEVDAVARSPFSDAPLQRLRWRAVPDRPPPTLLRAIRERLEKEALVLVCLRCGFSRTTTAQKYRVEGGSRCLVCHGSLSAVLSARREEEIDRLARYAKAKWRSDRRPPGSRVRRPRPPPPETETLVRAGYTSAELVAHHGERALLALAARGVGPETARRLLARQYRDDEAFLTELLRAERAYAKTRAFWD
jgi:ATP-dependent helicase Lhr and Lhr-like helicase